MGIGRSLPPVVGQAATTSPNLAVDQGLPQSINLKVGWTATPDLFHILLPYYHLNNGDNNKNNTDRTTNMSTYAHAHTPHPHYSSNAADRRTSTSTYAHAHAHRTSAAMLQKCRDDTPSEHGHNHVLSNRKNTFESDLSDKARGEGWGNWALDFLCIYV